MSVLAAGRRQCSVNLRYGVATAAAEAAAPSVASRRPHALLERHAACNGSLGLISTDRAPAVSKQCLPHRPADWPGTAPRRSCGRNDDGQRATSPPPARPPPDGGFPVPPRPSRTDPVPQKINTARGETRACRPPSQWVVVAAAALSSASILPRLEDVAARWWRGGRRALRLHRATHANYPSTMQVSDCANKRCWQKRRNYFAP